MSYTPNLEEDYTAPGSDEFDPRAIIPDSTMDPDYEVDTDQYGNPLPDNPLLDDNLDDGGAPVDPIVPQPGANMLGPWNDENKIKYKDGIFIWHYRLYDPEEVKAYNEEYDETHENALIAVRQNYMAITAAKFLELGWIEELAITAHKVFVFLDKKVFGKLNGMNRAQAKRWLFLWSITVDPYFNLDFGSTNDPAGLFNVSASYGRWQVWAVMAEAYKPQVLGSQLAEFPVKAMYMVVAALVLPQLIQGLPIMIKTFPEIGKEFAHGIKFLVGVVRKLTGASDKWPDWSTNSEE